MISNIKNILQHPNFIIGIILNVIFTYLLVYLSRNPTNKNNYRKYVYAACMLWFVTNTVLAIEISLDKKINPNFRFFFVIIQLAYIYYLYHVYTYVNNKNKDFKYDSHQMTHMNIVVILVWVSSILYFVKLIGIANNDFIKSIGNKQNIEYLKQQGNQQQGNQQQGNQQQGNQQQGNQQQGFLKQQQGNQQQGFLKQQQGNQQQQEPGRNLLNMKNKVSYNKIDKLLNKSKDLREQTNKNLF